jgi:hypothetical protein
MKKRFSITDDNDSKRDAANAAGQSGDLQGLESEEGASSESVTELLEEGQYYEASVLSGIENAPPADVSRVRTSEVLEDDVPEEYLDEERDWS